VQQVVVDQKCMCDRAAEDFAQKAVVELDAVPDVIEVALAEVGHVAAGARGEAVDPTTPRPGLTPQT
jgi:hypothetical protein